MLRTKVFFHDSIFLEKNHKDLNSFWSRKLNLKIQIEQFLSSQFKKDHNFLWNLAKEWKRFKPWYFDPLDWYLSPGWVAMDDLHWLLWYVLEFLHKYALSRWGKLKRKNNISFWHTAISQDFLKKRQMTIDIITYWLLPFHEIFKK